MFNIYCSYFGRILLIISTSALTFGSAYADANSVMNYSGRKLVSVCIDMAETVSLNAPVRVDKITVMLGAVCVPQTKTFIYKYETSEKLDAAVGKSFVIRHTYVMPSGQQMFDVRYSDC